MIPVQRISKFSSPTSRSTVAVIYWKFGGAEEGRTPGLRIANAALCQLSYCPTSDFR
jgi:hypothetical protein